MKFKNLSDLFKNFAIPQSDGSLKWVNMPPNEVMDIPDSEAWRARANGLSEIAESKPKPEATKPSKKKVEDILKKIKGLGKKAIEEILEEYDSIEEIRKDIVAKKFRVGGVDKIKLKEILENI